MEKKEKMRIFVNDDVLEFSGNTLVDLLEDNGFIESKGIAVAINETVISRDKWSSCILKEGDSLLIITPAQGG